MPEKELNLTGDEPVDSSTAPSPVSVTPPFSLDRNREETRGDLARGLLWLLTFAIGGILAFVGLGRLDGSAITQSIFPSLVALAGTALGFYFGSQTKSDSTESNSNPPLIAVPPTPPAPPNPPNPAAPPNPPVNPNPPSPPVDPNLQSNSGTLGQSGEKKAPNGTPSVAASADRELAPETAKKNDADTEEQND